MCTIFFTFRHSIQRGTSQHSKRTVFMRKSIFYQLISNLESVPIHMEVYSSNLFCLFVCVVEVLLSMKTLFVRKKNRPEKIIGAIWVHFFHVFGFLTQDLKFGFYEKYLLQDLGNEHRGSAQHTNCT